jgi:hypothetical protein
MIVNTVGGQRISSRAPYLTTKRPCWHSCSLHFSQRKTFKNKQTSFSQNPFQQTVTTRLHNIPRPPFDILLSGRDQRRSVEQSKPEGETTLPF